MLSDWESDSGESEELHQLTVNEHYEKAFNAKKEREELAKLKEKLGSDASENDDEGEDDSESDESEDEFGEELTPAADVAIFRTLAKIRNKDPAIYEKDANVFQEEESRHLANGRRSKTKTKDSKPIKMKEHILNSILNPTSRSPSPVPQPLTHVQEQAALRSETISAFHHAVEEEDDELLVPRKKARDELEREEEEYADFLRREVGQEIEQLVEVEGPVDGVEEQANEEEEKSDKKKKKKSKSKDSAVKKTKEQADQEFLMNYIMNRGWIDKTQNRVPTYHEVTTASEKKDDGEDETNDNAMLYDDDEDFEELADDFESSYNFRFEEPNASNIQRYPREIPSAVRRTDTTRIEARSRRKERKEEEKLQKKEEVKRLKALKMKDLHAKLERIGKEGGISIGEEDVDAIDLDLEGDWDPEKHDSQMARLYDESRAHDDLKKPEWEDDIDIDDIIPAEAEAETSSKKKKRKKAAEEDLEDGVNIDDMDADVEPPLPHFEDEEWDGTDDMRKRKLDEYMESLYKLEFNDIAASLPTRFSYVPVQATNFALSPAEILLAEDKDLNEYMALKKIAPYRDKKHREGWDARRAGRLQEFKEKMKMRGKMWEGRERERERDNGWGGKVAGEVKKKRKGKKERMRMQGLGADEVDIDRDGAGSDIDANAGEVPPPPRKKKRKDGMVG